MSEESPSAEVSPHSNAVSGETSMDKSKRYDRGIRVWGAHGQEALEAAKVCLLNAGPTGTEALKNLVLGGIHSFTIVDGAKVTPPDLGNNYLLTADGLGMPRAQCAAGAPTTPATAALSPFLVLLQAAWCCGTVTGGWGTPWCLLHAAWAV
jgi:molybdopterin/thiamine biosynthesis adenylyltransferase